MNGGLERHDRRVTKTKRAIRNAFVKLLSEKDFNEITVKDIADTADIDRKTLYNHYSGIYEIRDELENDLVKLLEQAVRELDFEKNIQNPQHIFEILTDILNTDLELYENLMKLNARSHIVRKMEAMLKANVRKAMEAAASLTDNPFLDLCADFVTAGMLSVYQNWFNSDRRRPLSEVSKEVGRLVLYGLHDFTDL
ncbi:MAG: TetR family transcriptional regulator [Clostridia bacterium]|jgi:AcrR family transcriptional regulator|nr:TetR family transcriptional regulator [Clostridia bacterium]